MQELVSLPGMLHLELMQNRLPKGSIREDLEGAVDTIMLQPAYDAISDFFDSSSNRMK
jgi:hypothetical protein